MCGISSNKNEVNKMAAYKCTHCGEDIWGIAVPMKGNALRYQHIHCYLFMSKAEEHEELLR